MKDLDISQRCCKRVIGPGSMQGHRCIRKGIKPHEGEWYCAQHYPPAVDARHAERKKWDSEWNARDENLRRSKRHMEAAEQICRILEASGSPNDESKIPILLRIWRETKPVNNA